MLIAVTGMKGSGKDTFAHALIKQGFIQTRFADPLKNMLRTLFADCGVDAEDYIEGPFKEVPTDILCGKTMRHAMQTLGTEWRDTIDRKLWSNLWAKKAELLISTGYAVVVTDCRFIHEAAMVRNMGGYIVRIERPTHRNDDPHISEQEMLLIEPDEIVINDGTISKLHRKAEAMLREYHCQNH